MRLITEIAKQAKIGDLEAINKLLDGAQDYHHAILMGRIQADKALRRDPPLPPLAEDQLVEIARRQALPRPTWKKKRARKAA